MTETTQTLVHFDLLNLAQTAFRRTDGRLVPAISWVSRSDWHPTLKVINTDWARNERGPVLNAAAVIIEEDGLGVEAYLDRSVTAEYMRDAYGLHFLEQFRKFFEDPNNQFMNGLLVMPRPGIVAMPDEYTSSPEPEGLLVIKRN